MRGIVNYLRSSGNSQRKGLAFSIVIGVILAMIGATALLGLYGSQVTDSGIFCGIYNGLGVIHPAFRSMKPAKCGQSFNGGEEVLVEATNEKTVGEKFVSYVSDCWNQNQDYGNVSKRCYLVSFSKIENDIAAYGGSTSGEIQDQEFAGILSDAGIGLDVCGGPSTSSCSTTPRPFIEWRLETINTNDLVQIKYENQTIIVR